MKIFLTFFRIPANDQRNLSRFYGKVISMAATETQTTTAAARVAFEYPEFWLISDRAILYRAGDGDAVGRRWLAGLRDHEASAGSWSCGPGAISPRHIVVSGFGPRRRPLRSAQPGRRVLCGVCGVFRIAALRGDSSYPFDLPDLRSADSDRHRARLQWARQPRAAAATRARRTFSERRGVGVGCISNRYDSRPVDWWARLCGVSWSFRGIYAGDDFIADCDVLCVSDQSRIASTRSREPISTSTILAGFHYIWRQKLILGSISLDLFAVLLGGAVALLPVYASEILRTGPWGLGYLAQRAGRRRGGDGDLSCAQAVARQSRIEDAGMRQWVWRLHDYFRDFAQPYDVDHRAGFGGRD